LSLARIIFEGQIDLAGRATVNSPRQCQLCRVSESSILARSTVPYAKLTPQDIAGKLPLAVSV